MSRISPARESGPKRQFVRPSWLVRERREREREREMKGVSTHHHHSTGEESLHQLNEGLNGMEQSCRSTRLQDEAVCRHIHAALTTERERGCREGGKG